MSSSRPRSEDGPGHVAPLARRRRIETLTDGVLAWPLLIGASAVWFFFGARLMSRFGPDALGPAAGVMIAAGVGLTLWLWSARDAHRESVAAGVCPRCHSSIVRFEERPRPGALADGLSGWRCENCGLEEAGPLTPERDAS